MHRASKVLPVPGGPTRRTPAGMRAPAARYFCGSRSIVTICKAGRPGGGGKGALEGTVESVSLRVPVCLSLCAAFWRDLAVWRTHLADFSFRLIHAGDVIERERGGRLEYNVRRVQEQADKSRERPAARSDHLGQEGDVRFRQAVHQILGHVDHLRPAQLSRVPKGNEAGGIHEHRRDPLRNALVLQHAQEGAVGHHRGHVGLRRHRSSSQAQQAERQRLHYPRDECEHEDALKRRQHEVPGPDTAVDLRPADQSRQKTGEFLQRARIFLVLPGLTRLLWRHRAAERRKLLQREILQRNPPPIRSFPRLKAEQALSRTGSQRLCHPEAPQHCSQHICRSHRDDLHATPAANHPDTRERLGCEARLGETGQLWNTSCASAQRHATTRQRRARVEGKALSVRSGKDCATYVTYYRRGQWRGGQEHHLALYGVSKIYFVMLGHLRPRSRAPQQMAAVLAVLWSLSLAALSPGSTASSLFLAWPSSLPDASVRSRMDGGRLIDPIAPHLLQ
eukprot:scaffold114_cov361-Pinguiococcus_pyrenoidosus.AAC.4